MTEQNWMVSLCVHIKVLLIRRSCVIWSNMFCCTVQIDGRERFFKRSSLKVLFKDRVFSWTSWTFSGKLMFKKVWSDPCYIQSSYLIWPLLHSIFLSYLTLVSFILPPLFHCLHVLSDTLFQSSCVIWSSLFWSSCVIWSLFHSVFQCYLTCVSVFLCCLSSVSVFLCYLTFVSVLICYLVHVSFRLPVLFGPSFIQSSCVIWPLFRSSCIIWTLFQPSCVIWSLFQPSRVIWSLLRGK